MLLIGKPGSGKTTLLKQLLTNPQMYHRKFDEVLLVSPSHTKMDIPVKKSNVTSKFSLNWLFKKIEEINEK
jgi:ABC-type multidrug transport system ATPase subunit